MDEENANKLAREMKQVSVVVGPNVFFVWLPGHKNTEFGSTKVAFSVASLFKNSSCSPIYLTYSLLNAGTPQNACEGIRP